MDGWVGDAERRPVGQRCDAVVWAWSETQRSEDNCSRVHAGTRLKGCLTSMCSRKNNKKKSTPCTGESGKIQKTDTSKWRTFAIQLRVLHPRQLCYVPLEQKERSTKPQKGAP